MRSIQGLASLNGRDWRGTFPVAPSMSWSQAVGPHVGPPGTGRCTRWFFSTESLRTTSWVWSLAHSSASDSLTSLKRAATLLLTLRARPVQCPGTTTTLLVSSDVASSAPSSPKQGSVRLTFETQLSANVHSPTQTSPPPHSGTSTFHFRVLPLFSLPTPLCCRRSL